MSQHQFEHLQSQLGALDIQQLQLLNAQIMSKLETQSTQAKLTDEELDALADLFN